MALHPSDGERKRKLFPALHAALFDPDLNLKCEQRCWFQPWVSARNELVKISVVATEILLIWPKFPKCWERNYIIVWQRNLFYLQNETDFFHHICPFFDSHSNGHCEMSRRGVFWEDIVTFNCYRVMQGSDIRGWIEARIGAHGWPRTAFGSFHSFLWMREK